MYNLENIGNKCTIKKRKSKHLYSPIKIDKRERKQIKLSGKYDKA